MAGKIDFQPMNWTRLNQMKAVNNAFARIEAASTSMVPDVEQKQEVAVTPLYTATQSRNDVVGMFFDRFA